ncbi:MAG: DUF6624 domain-containing protein [Pseudomonadota bacterium]
MKTALLQASLLAVVSFVLIAASDPPQNAPDSPEPPPFIAERIEDGRLEQGQFEYLRGFFPDASEDEKAQYAELIAWLDACGEAGKSRLDAELAQLGVSYDKGSLIGADNVCQQVILGNFFEEFASYSELAEATRGARLVFNTLVQSISRAEERTGPFTNDDLGGDLHHRTLGEQMLRLAFRWGWSEQTDTRVPKMTDKERKVFLALLNSEVVFVDHQNTAWLKALVGVGGWPKMSEVGERGSGAAWLLAQHADLDPAFQLRALKMMEPLVAEGEVSKRNYAYLYDRIMLKLADKQRFGTQLQCETGQRQPLPLEEPERVDELRAEMDLEPMGEYLGFFRTPCPKE